MFDIFIKRPVLSLVISLIITLLGALSLFTLPVTQFPDIVPPSVVVTANYTGANAEVCTDAVAIPLERAINGVPGMTYMTSVSTNNGTTMIQVFFRVGTDPDIAAVNVQNRVTTVLDELPEEVIKAGVTTEKEVNSMLMYLNIYSDDPTADERFIYNFTDINILKELKRIEGVGRAEIMGARDYAMRVWLEPDRMAAYSISTEEVIAALRAQNVEAAPGQTGIGSDKRVNMQQYVLRYPGKFSEPDEYRNIPIRSDSDGSILRIGDIADVEFGSLDYEMESQTDGRPSASIMMKQLPGSNAQDVIEQVKQRMAELKESSFPSGMQYTVSYDVSRFLDASISAVIRTLIEAFILVFLVVFIFLQDFRSTLIPALAVPVCLIGALFFMQMMGFSINLLTLFALVLAIGIVVDNAIVVVEAVHVKMEEEHLPPMEATLAAMREIGGAVVAITLVMSAVFVPVAFLSGPVGIFYRQFSLTLAASIVISGINALTLTPALCAIMLRPIHDKKKKGGLLNGFFNGFNRGYNRISDRYKGLVSRIAGRRVITLVLLAFFFVATWGISSVLPSGFIPTEDQGMIYVNVTTPPGATVDRTMAVLNEIDSIARQHEAVETVSTLGGYSIVTEVSGASYGMGMINLKPWEHRNESVSDVIAWLVEHTDHLKDGNIEYFPPPTVPGFGNSSGFELRLLDRSNSGDLAHTADILRAFQDSLEMTSEVGNTFSSFDPRFPQYLIQVDYDIAAKRGISVENAMTTLQTLMGSFYATNFIRFGQMYKVMVQAGPGYREKPEDVLRLYIKNKAGEMVPFSSFINMERIYGPEQVTRYNMFTSALVTGDAAPGYSSGEVINTVERVADEMLPPGYEIEWSGMTREQILSGNQAIYIFALCLLFVYLILAAQYESFTLPLPVILSLPAGVFGAFLLLKLLGLENNIYAQVALVMLIGLLGKNAILIIEYAVLKRKQGATVLQAAVEGAVARLRPILMTSFAFIAGLIPLAMASGAGALGNRSIGTTAVGGMIVGTLVGVILIPGLYVLFVSKQKRLKKKVPLVTTIVASIAAGALLLSCSPQKQLPLDRHQQLPDHYRDTLTRTPDAATDTTTIADIPWRSFFKDEKLVDLIDSTLANNPDGEKALRRIEIAHANLRMRKSRLFPNVDAIAQAGLRKFGFYTADGIGNYDTNFSDNLEADEKLPDPLPNYFVGLQTSWEIDLWGKLRNQKNAAYQRFLASYEGSRLVQTTLIEEVVTAYYDLLALDNELAILQKNIALQEDALAIIKVQKDAGRANELGVQQFDAVVHNSKAREQTVLQQIALVENQLNALLGRFEGTISRNSANWMTDTLPDIMDLGSPVQLLDRRPDVRQAKLALLAQASDLSATQAAMLPSIVLSPYIGFEAFGLSKLVQTPNSMTYGLLGGLTAPIFNQRGLRSAHEVAKATYGEVFLDYEKVVLNAWKEVQNNLSGRQYIHTRRIHSLGEVSALLKAVEAANALFKAGRASYLDVITVQRNVLQAELDLVEIRHEKAMNRFSLYKALGGGWQ